MNRQILETRIQELLDGNLPPARTAELYQVLAEDPEARACYYQYVALHQSLAFRLGRPPASESSRALAEAHLDRQRRGAIRLSLVAAAVALVVAAFVFRIFVVPPVERFAEFHVSEDTVWSIAHAEGSEGAGNEVGEGSRITLRQGTFELNFPSGSRMVVQAPADFRLVSLRHVRFPQGTGFFHIVASDKGFAVETGEMRVVDLGTEFGVLAQPDRAHEIHVLSGRVEARALRGTKSFDKLDAGQARRIDPAGRLLAIPLDRDAFPAVLPPGLLDFHFSFDSAEGSAIPVGGSHPAAADIRARYLNAAGRPAAPRLVPGRVGRAISLRGDGGRVVTDWPGFAGDVPRSISFWTRIESDTDLSHLPSVAGWGDPRAGLRKWNVTIANQRKGEPVVARISLGAVAYQGSTPLADGRWHHCVAVFSGNTTEAGDPDLQIYINGVRETLTRMEFGKAAAVMPLAPDTRTASQAARPLRIGVSVEGWPGSFIGLIDELRIHAGALSQEAVAKLFYENG